MFVLGSFMVVHIIFFPGLGFDDYVLTLLRSGLADDSRFAGFEFNFHCFSTHCLSSHKEMYKISDRITSFSGIKIVLAWSIGVISLINIISIGIKIADFYILASPFLSLVQTDLQAGYKKSVFDKMIESINVSKGDFLTQFLDNVLYPNKNDNTLFQELFRRSMAFSDEYFVCNLKKMKEFDAEKKIDPIKNVLMSGGNEGLSILLGRQDRVVPFLKMQHFASFFPKSCVTVCESGHNVVFENSIFLLRTISRFLSISG